MKETCGMSQNKMVEIYTGRQLRTDIKKRKAIPITGHGGL
jgi:hypothetical protein